MRFLPSVVRAEYRGDYRLYLVFDDGSANTLDFAQWSDWPILSH